MPKKKAQKWNLLILKEQKPEHIFCLYNQKAYIVFTAITTKYKVYTAYGFKT